MNLRQLFLSGSMVNRYKGFLRMPKPILRRACNRILQILARFTPGAMSVRPFLHRLRGVKIYGKVWIGDDVYLDNEFPEHLEIHHGAALGMRSLLIAHTRGPGRIIIDEFAYVGPGTLVVCPAGRTIRIGKGAMIGPGCIITSSVSDNAFMAAPKSKAIAKITIPFNQAASVDEFFAGLQPWKKI